MLIFSKEIFLDRRTIKELKNIKDTELKDKNLPKEILINFLKQRDIFISVFLVNLFQDKIEFVDDEVVIALEDLLKKFNVIPKNVNNLMIKIIKTHPTNVTIVNYMKTISLLDLHGKDFEFIKDYFGYSQIYKHSKNILSKMLYQTFTVNEIGYSLILLNHPELCYKNLLPLFKKINEYAETGRKKVLDKGIINVCIGIQAVTTFSPETFAGRNNLLLSILVFLNKILFYEEFYEFISLNDLNLFLSTQFTIVTIISLDNSTKNTLRGIFSKCLEQFNFMISKNDLCYEDLLFTYSLLYQMNTFFWFIDMKQEEKDGLKKLTSHIEDYKINQPKYIDREVFKSVVLQITKEKYHLLSNISLSCEYKLNTDVFIEDIENIDNARVVLGDIKPETLDWSKLINYVCKAENQGNFVDLVFILSNNQLITTYIESLVETKNLDTQIYLLTEKRKELMKLIENTKCFNLLFKIFLQESNSSEFKIFEIRKRILEILNTNKNNIQNSNLEELLKIENSENLYTLFLFIIMIQKEVGSDLLSLYINYTFKGLKINKVSKNNKSNFYKNTSQKAKTEDNILVRENAINNFDTNSAKKFIRSVNLGNEVRIDLESLSLNSDIREDTSTYQNYKDSYDIKLHVLALIMSKVNDGYLYNQSSINTYEFLVVKLLSYCFKRKLDDNFIKLEHELLEFLFIATEDQKHELEILYNFIKNNFKTNDYFIYLKNNEKLEKIIKKLDSK